MLPYLFLILLVFWADRFSKQWAFSYLSEHGPTQFGVLVDRITAGRVLDFIETPLRPGIFNVADVAINLGVIIILLAVIWASLRSRAGQTISDGPASR